MEKLLARVTAPFTSKKRKHTRQPAEADEAVWSSLDALNDTGLDALTKEVAALKRKIAKKPSESDEEPTESDQDGFGEEDGSALDDEGTEDDEDEDFDFDDVDGFDSLDPREQLRLLSKPCKDSPGFSDDDDDDDDEDQEEGGEEDANEDGSDAAQRDASPQRRPMHGLLDEEGSGDEAAPEAQSNFQKQQSKLRRTIAAYEAENVGEKQWAMRGEIQATARPVDSLLQEDLEFEHVAKMAPVITPDVTGSLEDIIRSRIKDAAWDDVERKPDEAQLGAGKKRGPAIALDDSKSKLSLAAQYEAEFEAKHKAASAKQPADLKTDGPVDQATKAQHDEIRKLFGKMCQALDGMAENKFAPRAYDLADVEIKTIATKK